MLKLEKPGTDEPMFPELAKSPWAASAVKNAIASCRSTYRLAGKPSGGWTEASVAAAAFPAPTSHDTLRLLTDHEEKGIALALIEKNRMGLPTTRPVTRELIRNQLLLRRRQQKRVDKQVPATQTCTSPAAQR